MRRVYVAESAQGQGIGHQLLDAALALPRVRNARNLYLDVWEHNLGAQRLYRRYGFKVIAERRYESASGTLEDTDYHMRRVQPQ